MAKNKKKTKEEMGSRDERVFLWFSKIARAEKRRDRILKDYGAFDFKEAFKGKLLDQLNDLSWDNAVKIPMVNLLWAIVKTEIPSLSIKNPHFSVNARKGSSISSAKIREIALNYLWRQKRLRLEVNRSLQDVELTGHAWFKTGFTGKFGAIEDGNGYVQEYIEKMDYFGYRVSWKDITFNAEAVNPPHDCRWIAHRFFRPLEDVKNNERYKFDRSKLIGSPLENTEVGEEDLNLSGSFESWVKMYEIWDIVNGKVIVLAEGVDEILEEKKWSYDLRGFPFSYLAFNEINDESYPVPEASMYIDQIINHIKIRFQQLDHLKRGNRQYETEKGNLDEETKRNLSLGLTGAVHEVRNGIGKINLIGSPAVPVDSYAIENRNLDDLYITAGFSPFDAGATGRTSTRTISEVIHIQRGARNRRSDKIDKLNEFQRDIARNLLSLIMQFGSEPFYVDLTGNESREVLDAIQMRPSATLEGSVTNERGFTFTKEDIQGEFDVEVKPGSTIELDRETKLEVLQKLAELAPALLQVGSPVAATIGRLFAKELDWPEIEIAIEQEIQFRQEQQRKIEERQSELQQIQAAQFGVEKQLDAEKIQSKNTGDLIRFATATVNASGGKSGNSGSGNNGSGNNEETL